MTIEKREEYQASTPSNLWLPFYGGLGDVILRCYETRFWHFLENTKKRVVVVVASVNPFTSELFHWHGNRSRIVLYELSHRFDDFHRRGLSGNSFHEAIAEFAGLSWPMDWSEYKVPPPTGWKPKFHAPDYLDDRGHFVFHPFAGLEHRALSGETLDTVVRFLGKLPCTVYVPSRDFVRFHAGRAGHGAENLPETMLPDNFVVLKNLSVPATLNLVRHAGGFVGTHSSLALAAAKEGVTSLVLYPDSYESKFGAAEEYESFVRMDHMTAIPMDTVSESSLRAWCSRILLPGRPIEGRMGQARVDRLAEWVFSQGGRINIDWFCVPDFIGADERKKSRNREIESADQLPRGRYRIWRLDFGGLSHFGDIQLAELRDLGAGIDTITNLNLARTAVSSSGIDSLGWLAGSLHKIRVGDGCDREEIERRLCSVLPGCTLVQ